MKRRFNQPFNLSSGARVILISSYRLPADRLTAERYPYIVTFYFSSELSFMKSELVIQTTDPYFYSALKAEKIPDLQIMERVFRIDSADLMPIVENVAKSFVIGSTSSVAVFLFKKWFEKHFDNNKTSNTTINNIDVINNPIQMNIVINNYVQEKYGEKPDDQAQQQ